MMLGLSKNRRRFLALGILLIVVLAVFTVLVQPYLYFLNASEEYLDAAKFEHFNNSKLLRKKDYYIESLAAMEDVYDDRDIYLKSSKRSLATAEMQDIFKQLANRSKAELISTQIIADEDNADNSIGLSARLRADIFGLQKLIYAIEAGSPRLNIKQVSIRRGGRAIFRYNNEQSSSQTLDVRLQVFGYVGTQ